MNGDHTADCYRLLSSGRLERIDRGELAISLDLTDHELYPPLGYEEIPCMRLGGDLLRYFNAEIHPRYYSALKVSNHLVTKLYRYLIKLTIDEPASKFIFVEDLPDLLPFLAQLSAIAGATTLASQHLMEVQFAAKEVDQSKVQGELDTPRA